MVTVRRQSVSYFPTLPLPATPAFAAAQRPTGATRPRTARHAGRRPAVIKPLPPAVDAVTFRASREPREKLAKVVNILLNVLLLIGLHGQADAKWLPVLRGNDTAREAIKNSFATPDAPNIIDPPALQTSLAPHRLTRSGLFDADETIINDVEAAETYLSQSAAARTLFARLQHAESPIRVSQSSNHSSQSGLGKYTSIQWDNTTYLESHDRIHAEHALPCGTNSAALVFIHEAHHAEWAISNAVGQLALLAMSHPFYDDLEEARVIANVNEEALQLHEDVRGSHRGRLHHAEGTLDRHAGICQDLHVLRPDDHLSHLPRPNDADFASNFVTNVPLGKTLFERLSKSEPPIPDVLLDDLSRVFDEHDALAREIIAELKRTDGTSVARELQQRYAAHIREAISVAAKFAAAA